MIETYAYARAGLIGNPSDGYFGRTIAVSVRNFRARVVLYESDRLKIRPGLRDRLDFNSCDDLIADIGVNGYYGGVRLIKASIKRFAGWCAAHGVAMDRQFTIDYDTNVPVRVGLAGSSSIITAVMRALMAFYEVEIPKALLPGVILSVELDELKIGAGLQDRVIQVYEGAVYMDFDRQRMERDGHGLYEPLDPAALPPLFVAYHNHLAEGTEITHNSLRDRYRRGEPEVLAAIEQWKRLAREARDLIAAGRGAAIGSLMNEAFDLRARLIPISEGNMQLIERGRRLGASTQFAGSGGAVIGCYDGDPERLERMRRSYEEMGAMLIVPEILG
jgi:glucuronokinase